MVNKMNKALLHYRALVNSPSPDEFFSTYLPTVGF